VERGVTTLIKYDQRDSASSKSFVKLSDFSILSIRLWCDLVLVHLRLYDNLNCGDHGTKPSREYKQLWERFGTIRLSSSGLLILLRAC